MEGFQDRPFMCVKKHVCVFFLMTFSNDLAIQCQHSHSTLILMYFSKFSIVVVKKRNWSYAKEIENRKP
jgi:hypothetical protein